MKTLYPLLLKPALHTRVWGSRKLETVMHKTLPDARPYGESWEMHDTTMPDCHASLKRIGYPDYLLDIYLRPTYERG